MDLPDLLSEELLEPVHRLSPLAIYHFGSTASPAGLSRMDSDLDLAFFAKTKCDPYAVFLAAQSIARLTRREVDLVDLRRVGDVMKVQVIGGGRRIFTCPAHVYAVDEFEMLALSGYARLNEERREVLDREGVAS